MRKQIIISALMTLLGVGSACADDIVWSVVSPFRFYRHERSFAVHRDAYERVLAEHGGVRPPDVVAEIERVLNDPGCASDESPDACANRIAAKRGRAGLQDLRLGWAHRTLGDSCYGLDSGSPSRYGYLAKCRRETASALEGERDEDYVAPSAHAVRLRLSDAARAAHAGLQCQWRFRSVGGATALPDTPCDQPVVFASVPYPQGGEASVSIAGAPFAVATIAVRDLLVVGLGDSFASGEGNPDRPVTFASQGSFNTSYDPFSPGDFGAWPVRATDPPVRPSAHLSLADATAVYAARARWTSPDCHRSQYSYQFRLAIELALEDPHRAVTLVHLACSGGDTWSGLFTEQNAREYFVGAPADQQLGRTEADRVRPQLQQLQTLLCDQNSKHNHTYSMWTPNVWGEPSQHKVTTIYPPCIHLKRNIDLVLLSIGGNDVGFSGMVGYSIMSSVGSVLPIAKLANLTGDRLIFAPRQEYVATLPVRLDAIRTVLKDVFDVSPARVIQTGYEKFGRDADDRPCSDRTGLDVVHELAFQPAQSREVDDFAARFLQSLACMTQPDASCEASLASKASGFHFVRTDEVAKGRGVCAVDGAHEKLFSRAPRSNGVGFLPYLPGNYFPYAHHRRLFVSADDSFMKAHTMLDWPVCPGVMLRCQVLTDKTQLLYSALYGGAFHRSAEAHSMIADLVLNEIARALAQSP